MKGMQLSSVKNVSSISNFFPKKKEKEKSKAIQLYPTSRKNKTLSESKVQCQIHFDSSITLI